MKLVDPHKDISCSNVLKCTFNLNEADVEVYRKLKELWGSKVEYLSQKLNKDSSTVYRSLQKLVFCEVCIKETKTIEKGGYYRIYLCADIKSIKKKMKACIDEWHRHVENTFTHFEKKVG